MTSVTELADVSWDALARVDTVALARTARALRATHLPPVSTTLTRPTGFTSAVRPTDLRLEVRSGRVCFVDPATGPDAVKPSTTHRDAAPVVRLDRAAVLDRRALAALRPYRSVLVPSGGAAGPTTLARVLAQLLVAGVPTRVLDLPLLVRELLGASLSAQLDSLDQRCVEDADRRAAWSVRTRRAALRALTTAGGVSRSERVVAVVDLRDDEHRERLVAEVAAQRWPAVDVVWLVAGRTGPVDPAGRVLVAADHHPVRAALGQLVAESPGALTTVMTAELVYAPDHLTDLVLAHGYAASTLVGASPRRSYLAGLDLTVESSVGAAGEGTAGEGATGAGAEGDGGFLHPSATLGRPHDLLACLGDSGQDTATTGYLTHDLSVTRLVTGGPAGNGRADQVLAEAGRQWSGWFDAAEGHPGDRPAGVPSAMRGSYFSRGAAERI